MNKTLAIVTGSLLATNIAGVVLSSNISYNNGLKVGNSEGQTVLADVDNKMEEVFQDGVTKGRQLVQQEQEDFRANPSYDKDNWNSEGNRIWMEHEIETNMVNTDDQSDVYINGVACFASNTVNKWHCVYRENGRKYSTKQDYEVNPRTLSWVSTYSF